MKLSISASAIQQEHVNRHPFNGVLTFVDRPSDKAPSGARGHRVILTRSAALAALPTLLGMPVSIKDDGSGHEYRERCGIITDAEIVGDELRVEGYLWKRDRPELLERIAKDKYGMSCEIADGRVVDMRQTVWEIKQCVFSGAAIILASKAAYKSTSFTVKDVA